MQRKHKLLSEAQKKQTAVSESKFRKQVEIQQAEISSLRIALDEMTKSGNGEAIACQVDLFKHCYEYFQRVNEQELSSARREQDVIIHELRSTIETLKTENAGLAKPALAVHSNMQFTPIKDSQESNQEKTSVLSDDQHSLEDSSKVHPMAQLAPAVITDTMPTSKRSCLHIKPECSTSSTNSDLEQTLPPTFDETRVLEAGTRFPLQSPTSAFVPCVPKVSSAVSLQED